MRALPCAVLLGGVLTFAACRMELPTAAESRAVCPAPPLTAGNSTVSATDTLFSLLTAPQLTAEQEQWLSNLRSLPTTAEIHLARLADDAEALLQEGNAVALPVSPTRSFTMIGTRVERRAENLSFSGPIPGEYGWVYLVLTPAGLTGTLQSLPQPGEPATYAFLTMGGGLHALVCVDQSKLPPDHPPGS